MRAARTLGRVKDETDISNRWSIVKQVQFFSTLQTLDCLITCRRSWDLPMPLAQVGLSHTATKPRSYCRKSKFTTMQAVAHNWVDSLNCQFNFAAHFEGHREYAGESMSQGEATCVQVSANSGSPRQLPSFSGTAPGFRIRMFSFQ